MPGTFGVLCGCKTDKLVFFYYFGDQKPPLKYIYMFYSLAVPQTSTQNMLTTKGPFYQKKIKVSCRALSAVRSMVLPPSSLLSAWKGANLIKEADDMCE